MLLGFAGIPRMRDVIHMEAVTQLLTAFLPFVEPLLVLYSSLHLHPISCELRSCHSILKDTSMMNHVLQCNRLLDNHLNTLSQSSA